MLATLLTLAVVPAQASPTLLDAAPQQVLGVPEWLGLRLTQTSEVWANPVGGFRRRAVYTGALVFGATVDLDGAGVLTGASIGALGGFVQGRDLSSTVVGDAWVVSNVAGRETVRLLSAWYEQRILDELLAVKVGLLPLDDDFMILDRALLFVGSGFGTVQTLALNLPVGIYPLSALGLRIRARPSSYWAFQLGVYDGSAGAEPDDRYAGDLALNGDQAATVVSELALRPPPDPNAGQLVLGALVHLGRLDPTRSGEPSRGLGLVHGMAEGRLARLGESELGAFAHGSLAFPAAQAVAEAYADVGLVLSGGAWARPDDRLGLGYALTLYGGQYVRARRDAGAPVTDREHVLELTYRAPILPWVEVQPTLQAIFDAHFSRTDALVLGLRATVAL